MAIFGDQNTDIEIASFPSWLQSRPLVWKSVTGQVLRGRPRLYPGGSRFRSPTGVIFPVPALQFAKKTRGACRRRLGQCRREVALINANPTSAAERPAAWSNTDAPSPSLVASYLRAVELRAAGGNRGACTSPAAVRRVRAISKIIFPVPAWQFAKKQGGHAGAA